MATALARKLQPHRKLRIPVPLLPAEILNLIIANLQGAPGVGGVSHRAAGAVLDGTEGGGDVLRIHRGGAEDAEKRIEELNHEWTRMDTNEHE